LAARPASVGELAATLPVSRPAVSQHLRVLKAAGLVNETAEGTRRIYRIDPRGIAAMREWLDDRWAASLESFNAFVDSQAGEETLQMSIAPIVRSIKVNAQPARAFELFTRHMERWWPAGKTIGRNPHVTIVMEPHAGGQWFERDAEGNETHWGRVLAWEPPGRLLLGWQINSQWVYDPDFLTEVELTFVPAENGSTLVTLEHRNLERFGADAEKQAKQIGEGWPKFLAEFSAYSNANQ
jgi:uncharacterized protein YndB with AHSA1/START domain